MFKAQCGRKKLVCLRPARRSRPPACPFTKVASLATFASCPLLWLLASSRTASSVWIRTLGPPPLGRLALPNCVEVADAIGLHVALSLGAHSKASLIDRRSCWHASSIKIPQSGNFVVMSRVRAYRQPLLSVMPGTMRSVAVASCRSPIKFPNAQTAMSEAMASRAEIVL